MLWSLAPGMLMVYGAQGLRGVAMAGGTLIWLIGAMYFAPKDELPLYMGLHTTFTGVRGLVAPFLGAWLARHIGTPGLFRVSCLLCWLSSLPMLRLAQQEQQRRRDDDERDA